MGSSTRCRRLFWPFDHDRTAWRRLGMKTKRSPRRFSASLARTSGVPICDKIAGITRRTCRGVTVSAVLPRGDSRLAPSHVPSAIGSSRYSRSGSSVQIALESAHARVPEQILFQIAVSMLMRKAPPIAAPYLCQGNIHLGSSKETNQLSRGSRLLPLAPSRCTRNTQTGTSRA